MPQKIRYGNRHIVRDSFSRARELFSHVEFLDMIDRQLVVVEKHAADYPLLDKDRTVTIKLSLKPLAKIKDGEVMYNNAEFTASVGSPSLPATSIPFQCAVSNGRAYFNVEDPDNPHQLTLRDMDGDDEDEPVVDGKMLAAGV